MPAFILKWVAPILIVLAVVGGIYAKGQLDARHAAELATVQRDLKTATNVLKLEREARTADAALAQAQAQRINTLSAQSDAIQEYADALEDARRECLSGAGNERLRDLWK
ncbi:hypothetical protein CO661_24115 [Sinorhizobium fredii]|uniref:Uncharacterized protein n=1 Tax=Rhizobium fredii TaxID=380 RepID=A0A2A6LT10_RHIFR|nr:hypothetical protein [Sinorhizobium fredii]PDT45352.1 hypothetical protein CO661_24115 [Sinorhizobium fredii]